MDCSSHSITESSLPDIIGVVEIEAEVVKDMKMLDKEVDEALVNAFNDISENEDKSAGGSESEFEGHEQILHTDSSFTLGKDSSSAFSTENPTLLQSDAEYENELANDGSCSKTEENYNQNPASNLQDSQNVTFEHQRKVNILLGELAGLKLQLPSIQNKFECSDVAIQSLKTQLSQPNKDDKDLSNLHGENKSSLGEIKLQHEIEVIHYKHEIERLQSLLNAKDKQNKSLVFQNVQLRMKCNGLELKNSEIANQVYEELRAQRKCQAFLESGTMEEVSRLKSQVRRLEREKWENKKSYARGNFLQQWIYSLYFWQLRWFHKVGDAIGFPYFG